MLSQLKVNIRSFLKLLSTPIPNPHESTEAAATQSTTELRVSEADQVLKENDVFNERVAPYSWNLSLTTFNSILLLLNVSVSETLSADIFQALQDQYVEPLTTQLFQSFLFEDKDHHRAQQLHYIEMLCYVINRSLNAETCNPTQWQKYYEWRSQLEALMESIQKVDASRPHTPDIDQSFSSISSTSIISCKILSGSTTPSNSRSSSGSNESTSTTTSPPNQLHHHRKMPLLMNRKLIQLDDTLGHRVKHVELPKENEVIKQRDAYASHERKKSSTTPPYYDEVSDSEGSRQSNPRVRTPRSSQGLNATRDSLQLKARNQNSKNLSNGSVSSKETSRAHLPLGAAGGTGGVERSLEMSDGYDSGDFNRELVAQRRRSMRGNVRVRRSNTTDELGRAYESLVFCDEEHLSSSRQNIQSVLGDPNDI
jgi:hypothetical protein